MSRPRVQDRIFGAAVALAAAAFLVVLVPGIEVPLHAAAAAGEFLVGPRFFPYLAGVLCLVLGGILAVAPGRTAPAAGPPGSGLAGLMNVALFMAVAIAYPLAWQPLGFILASSAALLVLLLLFGARSVPVVLGVVVLVPLGLAYLFQGLMNVVLPEGPLGLRF